MDVTGSKGTSIPMVPQSEYEVEIKVKNSRFIGTVSRSETVEDARYEC